MKLWFALLAVLLVAAAGAPATAGSYVSGASDGVAIQGYDTVAYWTEENAVKGKPEFSVEWAETFWFFSTAENRDLFAQNPEKYAPQYGGHCAMSVAGWRLSRGAGDAWALYDGKLYLNGSKEVRDRWRPRAGRKIYEADQAWPSLKQRLAQD